MTRLGVLLVKGKMLSSPPEQDTLGLGGSLNSDKLARVLL